MSPRLRALLRLALLSLTFALIPNGPALFWYAVPETICGWFESDEDQWRCDMDPVVPPGFGHRLR